MLKNNVIKLIALAGFLIFQLNQSALAVIYPKIIMKDHNNQILNLVREPLDTFAETPIKKTKARINSKYNNENFFSLYMLNLNHYTNGEKVAFNLQIGDQPLRISFLSIDQKTEEDDRILVSYASVYLEKNGKISDELPVFHYHENLNFIFAEQLNSKDEISNGVKQLQILRERKLFPVVDFGTNWSMSELNLEFDFVDENKKNINLEMSFDQLLKQFSNLKWVIAIRTSQID